jgi:hypothetical protein
MDELWAARHDFELRIGSSTAAMSGPRYRKPEEFWRHVVFFLQPSDHMLMDRMHFEDI